MTWWMSESGAPYCSLDNLEVFGSSTVLYLDYAAQGQAISDQIDSLAVGSK